MLHVFKDLAEELSGPLTMIFQNDSDTGEVSEDWKKANIVVVIKNNYLCCTWDNTSNYRPVNQPVSSGKIMAKRRLA